MRVSSLHSNSIRWREEFHWDDVVFHIDCLLAGMRVEWMPRSVQPDAYYRLHGGEHYGAMLRSVQGVENVGRMFCFLVDRLRDSGALNSTRHVSLKRSFFLTSFLPAIDQQSWFTARSLISLAEGCALLTRREAFHVRRFLDARKATVWTPRLRYFVNRMARKFFLPHLFEQSSSTYCATELGHEERSSLNALLQDVRCSSAIDS